MFPTTKTLLALVSCALLAQVQAQATPDACIIACATSAAAAGNCTSYTDLPCICTSTAFQAAAGACLVANCTAADLTAAQALQQQECANVTSTASSTGASSTGATATATSSSSSASATSSSTTKSNAALALAAPFSFDTLVGTLVASAGALVGAAFVL